MSQRSNQEDKFKNITLKTEPIRQPSPDIVSTHAVRPTYSPTNYSAHRPIPVVHHHIPAPQPALPHNVEISTSHIIH